MVTSAEDTRGIAFGKIRDLIIQAEEKSKYHPGHKDPLDPLTRQPEDVKSPGGSESDSVQKA